jgi:hypothetical protein
LTQSYDYESYNASVVKIYTLRIAKCVFQSKNSFFYFEKRSGLVVNSKVSGLALGLKNCPNTIWAEVEIHEIRHLEWRLVYVLAITDRWLPRLSRVVLSSRWLIGSGRLVFGDRKSGEEHPLRTPESGGGTGELASVSQLPDRSATDVMIF